MQTTEQLVDYIEQQSFETLTPECVSAIKAFTLDSVGVGLSGSRMAMLAAVTEVTLSWGGNSEDQAQVWGSGQWLPVPSAAFINAYQIHNQEWDCVHEPAVVHPMATILAALLSYAQAHQVEPKPLMLGLSIAVDIATLIGRCATSGLTFFRPSVCGALGATAGIAKMAGFNREQIKDALGVVYSQISGTMQAHVEGSMMLALQIATNARSAVVAIDMVKAGISGPHDILTGEFGFFRLFEEGHDLAPLSQLGKEYQMPLVSHKPFPSGRASHGTVDALQRLQQQHGFSADEVEHIHVQGTPLINRLVGRPIKDNMDVGYAKLCNGYIAACTLLNGNVDVSDFDQDKLSCKTRLALGRKVTTSLNDCDDVNALAPVTVTVTLTNGDTLVQHLTKVLGHPESPLDLPAQLDKFSRACASASKPLNKQQSDELAQLILQLEQQPSLAPMLALMTHTQG